ncbi:leucine-rich repeat-containing protein 4B-like [Branchiostoma floridae]|uniref:Leucine-rich repeat-containing protein 4B-like n=1 Tax=Branchiostoma floridae TaxID=7739 RepID=A0A9J7LK37_BRAFL|nr:leucine-rich repeat-containing protein 4B-like [Branchiostoma floridae]
MAPRKCLVWRRRIVPLLVVLAGLVERVMLASCPAQCVCEAEYTTVSCTNGGLQQVPKGTPYGALSLSLSGNNISGVIDDQFEEFRQLQTLDLSFNTISEIEDGAFVGLESLHTLQLYYNRLTSIPSEALRRLPHLKELWLRGNPINCLDADAFTYLPNLQLLDLGELRHLEAISDDVFTGLSKLVHLNFAVANLQTVPYLDELESLEELDLSGNSIKVINTESFSGLSKLKRLIIISSQVTEIKRFSFSYLKSLTELDLSFRHRQCRHDHTRSPDDEQDDQYMVNGMIPQTSFYGLVLSEEQKPETPPPVYSIDVDDDNICDMYHSVKTFKSDKPTKTVKTVTFKVETEV